MIPLGVLASARVAPSGGGVTVIAHDVFNCGVSHTLAQHVTAGHPLVGSFVSSIGNTRVDAAEQTMYFDTNAGYAVRVLADAGSGAMRAEGRIVGQAYVGVTAQDRHHGLLVGAPAVGAADAIGAVSLAVTPAGVVCAGTITSFWTPPGAGGGNARGTIPAEIRDDFTVAMSVTGLDVAITVNGVPFAAFALAAPPPGTHAGAHISRVRWDAKVGYKHLRVEAL